MRVVPLAAKRRIAAAKPSGDWRMKRKRFAAVGALDKQVITYCGGGIAASADALALVMLGHTDVKLYDASLSEWASDPSLPMETG